MLAACSPEKDPVPTRAEAAKSEAAPVPSANPPKASAAIAVDAEGLRLIAPESGSARALPFGSDQAAVIAAIEKLRGAAKRGRGEECGAGPVDFAHFGGFSLLFQDGKFGGWALQQEEAGGIGTMNGVAIGSTREALEGSFPAAKIDPESTLGIEFYTGGDAEGGMSGLLDGAGKEAKITNLWSGLNCVFR
jgi:hypothetical protein